jgi:hypothetical protein
MIISITPSILEIGVQMKRGVKHLCPYKTWNGLILMEECQLQFYMQISPNINIVPMVPCRWPTYILNIFLRYD